jgi:murein DD-endopeptidase MepM/ murein hydrolase activator NlpD
VGIKIMHVGRLARLKDSLERAFPERHLYVRSGGEIHGYVLSTGKQVTAAIAVGLFAVWIGVASAATLSNVFQLGPGDQDAVRTKAYYERLIADRQARLNSAVAQLSDTTGNIDDLAKSIEKRHAALTMVLAEAKGVPGAAGAMAPMRDAPSNSPIDKLRFVRMDQDRLIAQAETFAKGRADRLRLALRLAGLNPGTFTAPSGSLGGPLIEAKDPKALAAVLDIDDEFAQRVQHASLSMQDMRNLSAEAQKLPLGVPTFNTARSSGYGVRFDPFTHHPALHSGLDFAGGMMTPVYSTAPGIVSFTGVRSGYGNTIEVDHGSGFKTRYAHLQAIGVSVGQRVAVGQRIGGMGSTGRSTGPHLHYEVWVDGRPQNPDRFLRAGEYVQQANN